MEDRRGAPLLTTLLMCLLPVALVAACIRLFGLNIPFVDQFTVVALLERQKANVLTLADLFAQNNENRPFFPRLIWLGLAGLSHYDVRWELWANLVIAVATFAYFAVQASRTWRQSGVPTPPLLLALISFLVFNLSQWASWLEGFQLVMFLGSACVIIGFFLLAGRPSWGRFGLAAIAGIVGSFSTPNDLLYWPLGLAIIFIASPSNLRLLRAALWILCGTGSIILFLTGWTNPYPGLGLGPIALEIPALAAWVTTFLGAPLMPFVQGALPLGLLSLVLWAVFIWRLRKTADWSSIAPYLALAAFVVLTGSMISVGRARLGLFHAVAPRYLTISVWYWAALLTLAPLVRLGRISERILYSLVLVCLAFLTVWGAALANEFHKRMLPAYEAAVSGAYMSDEVLKGITFPGTYDGARVRLQYLAQEHLSAYYSAGE